VRITAEPRSDQLNYDDMVGSSHVYTIVGVKPGAAEQKYDIELAETPGRWWRPPLTMLRVLMAAWGDETDEWTGRQVELFGDAEVTFGRDKVGGIRILAMSHLPTGDKPFQTPVTQTRGHRKPYTVQPLKSAPTSAPAQPDPTATLTAAIASEGIETAQMPAFLAWASERQLGRRVGHPSELNDADRGDLLDNLPALANNFLVEVAQEGAES